MQIDPDILTNMKFRYLEGELNIDPIGYLVRLWLWCQEKKDGRVRGRVWKTGFAPASYVEALVQWKGEPGKLYAGLVKYSFIEEQPGNTITIVDCPQNPPGGHWKVTLPWDYFHRD